MSDQNVQLVQGAYEAFGRGDVPAVLGVLADDIAWSVPPPLPQAVEAHGPGEVGAFFERLGSIWEGLDIQVTDFVASGDRVCVIGRGSGKVGGEQARGEDKVGKRDHDHTRRISRLSLPSGRAPDSVTNRVSLTATVNLPHSRSATGTCRSTRSTSASRWGSSTR